MDIFEKRDLLRRAESATVAAAEPKSEIQEYLLIHPDDLAQIRYIAQTLPYSGGAQIEALLNNAY